MPGVVAYEDFLNLKPATIHPRPSSYIAGGDGFRELDIYVLRVAAFQERWECVAEEGCALEPRAEPPLSQMRRMQPAALLGEWKVFDISAVPILETDVDTGALHESEGW